LKLNMIAIYELHEQKMMQVIEENQ
jgi:hypothetical protein